MELRRKFWIFAVIFGCILLWYFGTRAVTVPLETDNPLITSRDTYPHTVSTRDVPLKKEAPLITLCTTWSTYPEGFVVYNNTLRNWPSLQPQVKIILFTNDVIPDEMKQLGWIVLPVPRQIKDHPVLKYMFIEAMKLQPNSKLYGFVNGDLLLTNSLIHSLQGIVSSPLLVNKKYMVVGRRMNTPNVTREEASSWETIEKAAKRGVLMPDTYGIDYFITRPEYHWKDIPEVQVGNAHYDNWLLWDARRTNHELIDATGTLLAVHQNAPIPKQHGRKDNNRDYIDAPPSLRGKGTISCCSLRTVRINGRVILHRRTQLNGYCKM